jgi:integrase
MGLVRVPNSPYWYSRILIHGKQYQKSTKTRNKAQARTIDERFRTECLSGILDGRPCTIAEALSHYTPPHPQKGVVKFLTDTLGLKIDVEPLATIDTAFLLECKSKLEKIGRRPATVFAICGHLFRMVNHCRQLGYRTAKENKMPKIRIKNARIRWLSLYEEAKLLEILESEIETSHGENKIHAQNDLDYTIFLLDIGCRKSEAEAVRWSDIDWTENTIGVWRSKTSNETRLHLTTRLAKALRKRALSGDHNPKGYIFGPHRWNSLRRTLATFDSTLHTLRHTFASRCLQNGVTIFELKEILGHASLQQTSRYSHLELKVSTRNASEVLNRVHESVEDHRTPEDVKQSLARK